MYPFRLRAEDNFDYEVIVCDDGSLDDTAPIISRLAGVDNLVPFLKPVNGGLAATFGPCYRSQVENIVYLDGDDLALPGKLQQQVDYLDQHPTAGWSITSLICSILNPAKPSNSILKVIITGAIFRSVTDRRSRSIWHLHASKRRMFRRHSCLTSV